MLARPCCSVKTKSQVGSASWLPAPRSLFGAMSYTAKPAPPHQRAESYSKYVSPIFHRILQLCLVHFRYHHLHQRYLHAAEVGTEYEEYHNSGILACLVSKVVGGNTDLCLLINFEQTILHRIQYAFCVTAPAGTVNKQFSPRE